MQSNPSSPERDTKSVIFQTAFKLFATHGYQETSISMIAKNAGISKGLMYHYYRNKEDLLLEVLKTVSLDQIKPANWDNQAPPKENLKRLIDLFLDYIQHQTYIKRFSLFLHLQGQHASEVLKLLDANISLWEKAFEELFLQLQFKDAQGEAIYLLTMLDGLALRHISKHSYGIAPMRKKLFSKYGLV